jgi:dUTP pyrophosphatase
MIVKFQRLRDNSIMPEFGGGDVNNAGIDFFACLIDNPIIIRPGTSAVIPTGVAWEAETPRKVVLVIQSRSGLAFRFGIEASNAGIIDKGYRGEINILLYNNGRSDYTIYNGQRVAQGIVMELPEVEIEESNELSDSPRSTKGFGSTGM